MVLLIPEPLVFLVPLFAVVFHWFLLAENTRTATVPGPSSGVKEGCLFGFFLSLAPCVPQDLVQSRP